jgi:hypothetical protein
MTAPRPTPTLRDALAAIEVQTLEERYGVEVRAIHLDKTASGNVRVQRTIAVKVEVAL